MSMAHPGPHGHGAGCACGIDVHAHVIPARAAALSRAMRAGRLAVDGAGACLPPPRDDLGQGLPHRVRARLEPDAAASRTWRRWACRCRRSRRCRSCCPTGWSRPRASQLLRYMNDQIAEMAALSGGAWSAWARCRCRTSTWRWRRTRLRGDRLGFRAIEIGSNINGKARRARIRSLLRRLRGEGRRGVRARDPPAGTERLVGPAPKLLPALGYPTDVGLAAASVLTSNLLVRHPALKIAFSHGGGTLASLLPRLEQARQVFPALKDAMPVSPSEQARRLFYDTLVFDPPRCATCWRASARPADDRHRLSVRLPRRAPVAAHRRGGRRRRTCAPRLVTHNAARFLGLAPDTSALNA
jgi:aminocarboxymuconate-semialdehyde decarboxylase